MRAVVQKKYGPPTVLRVEERPTPSLRLGQVLVKVRATSVHADVWHCVSGLPRVLRLMGGGLWRPKNPIPGTDLAGTVVELGEGVSELAVGERVFGDCSSGHQWKNAGAFAEYAAVDANKLRTIPPQLSFEEAASLPTSGMIALQGLLDEGQLQSGERVLINGAAGAVGQIAVQVALAHGAQVTAVDLGEKFDLLRQIGAQDLVDYSLIDPCSGEPRYDLVLDIASTLSLERARPVLKAGGRYVLIGHDHYGEAQGQVLGSIPPMLALAASRAPELPRNVQRTPQSERLDHLRRLAEEGQLRPVIDRCFPLEEACMALRYLMGGQSCGRILLTP